MNETITLASGASLELGMADFKVGLRLFQVICRELKLVDIDIDFSNLKQLAGKDINTFKNAILQLAGSESVEKAVFDCMAKSLYNGQRIEPKTFEPEDARGDFLPVAWEVIKYNLVPFFKNLGLSLPESPTTPAPSQP